MSRAVPLDHAFDKVKFAELLKRAQGDRQQNTFADDIGMSKTYLNSYLGAKNDKPLTVECLIHLMNLRFLSSFSGIQACGRLLSGQS